MQRCDLLMLALRVTSARVSSFICSFRTRESLMLANKRFLFCAGAIHQDSIDPFCDLMICSGQFNPSLRLSFFLLSFRPFRFLGLCSFDLLNLLLSLLSHDD